MPEVQRCIAELQVSEYAKRIEELRDEYRHHMDRAWRALHKARHLESKAHSITVKE